MRVVEGIVLPYGRGKVARVNGRRWRFQPGSLTGTAPLLLRDHDHAQRIGKLIDADDRPDGMYARYRVACGPDGDRAYIEAGDGTRAGFSVGVDIEEADPDPDDQGVLLAVRAVWRETSLLAVPAFDGARVQGGP